MPTGTTATLPDDSDRVTVNYTITATDNSGEDIIPDCTPASGTPFTLGDAEVICTATDSNGIVGTAKFTVSVTDETPPVISDFPDRTETLPTDASTIAVTYNPTASDNSGLPVTVECIPASGHLFPLGETTVTCTAIDSSNNEASETFTVTVNDESAPTFSSPTGTTATLPANSATVPVPYTITATDNSGQSITPDCTPASGTEFTLGETTVTCTAADSSGNSDTTTFTVTVDDNTPPTFSSPTGTTATLPANSATVPVPYTITATDNSGQSITPDCTPASGTEFTLGETTVTCTAADSSGNSDTTTFTVTVDDNTPPTFSSPTGTTATLPANSATVPVPYTITATDNSGQSITPDCTPASGTEFTLGSHSVTCTAVDNSGNSDTTTFTVTVNDQSAPTFSAATGTTATLPANSATVPVPYTITATDNSGESITPSCTPASGTEFTLGSHSVTCTATDSNNNTGTTTFTVTVDDNTPPTFSSPTGTTATLPANSATVPVPYTITATDNSGESITPSCTPASGTEFTLGSHSVSCTAADNSGNSDTTTFTVTVDDNTPPTFSSPTGTTATLPANSDRVTVPYTITATDNSGESITPSCTPASGTEFTLGETTVTCTAADSSGNSDTTTFTVTVNDQSAPTFSDATDNTATLPANSATVPVPYTITSSDNSGLPVTLVCTPASGDEFGLGRIGVTCIATDSSGNSATGFFFVTVTDVTPPTFSSPTDTTATLPANSATVPVPYTITATDNSGETITPVCTPASGTEFTLGDTPVSCTASDNSGNSDTTTFTVTVNDSSAPTFSTATGTTATLPDDSDRVTVNYTITASDNSGLPITPVCTPASGTEFTLGETTVRCDATDSSGNTATKSFRVTVTDNTPPTISGATDRTATLPPGSNTIAVDYNITTSDNSGQPVTLVCIPTSEHQFTLSGTDVRCTATDSSGNKAIEEFTVTVTDNTLPVISGATNRTVTLPDNSDTVTVTYTITATDNGQSITPSCTPASGTEFTLGVTTVECTATDSSGNAASETFTVTVIDDTAPTISGTTDRTATLSRNSDKVAVTYTITATDNYDQSVTVECDPASGHLFPLRETEVTCTATDSSGNVATETFTVTVSDTTLPTFSATPDRTTTLPSYSNTVQVNYIITATDNSGETIIVECNPAPGHLFSLGVTTVTCTAEDSSGNEATATFRVTVDDRTNPTISGATDRTAALLPNSDMATVTYTVTASDNSGLPVTATCDPSSGSPFPLGDTDVTCTATDSSGNEASETFTVTVIDNIAPTISDLPDRIETLPDDSNTIAVTYNPTASDNSGQSITVSCNPPSGHLFPLGETTVTCTATDSSNNDASETFTVTVDDRTGPTFSDATGTTATLPANSDRVTVNYRITATDNSGESITPSCTPASGTEFTLGDHEVTCTAIDSSNNDASETFRVFVNDITAPVISTPTGTTATLPENSNRVTVNYRITATDNSGETIIVDCTPESGSPFTLGPTEVTCTATDSSRNEATEKFTVTVNDESAPTFSTPTGTTATLPENSNRVTVNYSITATDNSGESITPSCTPASGTEFTLGTTQVTCDATDSDGNIGTTTFIVTVIDDTPPTFSTPTGTTATLPPNSDMATVTYTVTASDNSGLPVTATCDPPSGDQFPLEDTKVTCTATDSSSNTGTTTFTVTVTDNTAPVISGTPDRTATLPSNSDRVAVTYNPTASDNSGETITVECDPASGTEFTIANTNVSCTATDSSGNIARASFTVIVTDNTPPEFSAATGTTATLPSDASTVAVPYTVTASDNSGEDVTVDCTHVSGDQFPLGDTTVECFAEDSSGNISSTTFTVTVNDRTGPTFSDATGTTATLPANSDRVTVNYRITATDNSGESITPSCTPASGTEFTLGDHEVTCTATDSDNNIGTTSFTVTVIDETPPTISGATDRTVTLPPGSNTIAVDYNITTSDNSGQPVTLVCIPTSEHQFTLSGTNVRCTATDSSGNEARATFTVTVIDETLPTFSATPDRTAILPSNSDRVAVTYNPTASDNSGRPVTITCTPASGYQFPLEETEVECTATDFSGNEASARFTVTVTDETPPTISGAINRTISLPPGSNTIAVDYNITTSDNSGLPVTLVCDPESGNSFSKGSTPVECTATDSSGNSDTARFTVTVTDDTPPTFSTPTGTTATLPSDSDMVAVSYSITATDNSGNSIIPNCTPASGSDFPLDDTLVTCTATDSDDLVGTTSFTVTVTDDTPPTFSAATGNTATLPPDSSTVAVPYTVSYTITATDNSGESITPNCTPASGTQFDLGETTVTCTAEDSSGNESDTTFTVSVIDDTPPTISGFRDIAVTLSSGSDTSTIAYGPRAEDNSGESITVDCTPESGSSFSKGVATVTCTAEDSSGNVATATFTVTVSDTTLPTFSATPDRTTTIPSYSNTVPVPYIITATDNSGQSIPVECDPPSGTQFSLGVATVTCTATDDSGNTATATFTVTVDDKTRPVISTPTGTTATLPSDSNTVPVNYIITATDNSEESITPDCTHESGTEFPLGETEVTCTATDSHTNEASKTFTVTVTDDTAPVISGATDRSATLPPGSNTVTVTYDVTATDNSGQSVTVDCTPASGSQFTLGSTQVTCTATDSSRNEASATFTVTVTDDTLPVISGADDITIPLPSDASTVIVEYDVTATDNSGQSITPDCTHESGSLFELGETIVTCTAEDSDNNIETATFTVTVTDETPPTFAATADHTATLPSGSNKVRVTYTVTATDNSGEDITPTCMKASGSKFSLGENTVTCTAKDSSKNKATTTFTVTVTDDTPPVISGATNRTAALPSDASTVIVEYDVTATDNSGDDITPSCTPASGTEFELGDTDVTCTAEDSSGNGASKTFTVIVNDQSAPTFSGATDRTATLPRNSDTVRVTYDITASDNSGEEITPTCTPESESKFSLGETQVTCTATDSDGNIGTATFAVTVNDRTAPVISTPQNLNHTVLSDGVTLVTTYDINISDNSGEVITPVCTPPSGGVFKIGHNTIRCFATDSSGNEQRKSVQILIILHGFDPVFSNVEDITIPLPPDSDMVAVTYNITAIDSISTPLTPVCTPPSGSKFSLGDTEVTCTATDLSTNITTETFTVTVIDETPPTNFDARRTIATLPSDASTVAVPYTVTASDNSGLPVNIVCDRISGSQFVLGNTTVTCTVTDYSDNAVTETFTITVNEPEASVTGLAGTVTERHATFARAAFTWDTLPDVIIYELIANNTVTGDSFKRTSSEIPHIISLFYDNEYIITVQPEGEPHRGQTISYEVLESVTNLKAELLEIRDTNTQYKFTWDELPNVTTYIVERNNTNTGFVGEQSVSDNTLTRNLGNNFIFEITVFPEGQRDRAQTIVLDTTPLVVDFPDHYRTLVMNNLVPFPTLTVTGAAPEDYMVQYEINDPNGHIANYGNCLLDYDEDEIICDWRVDEITAAGLTAVSFEFTATVTTTTETDTGNAKRTTTGTATITLFTPGSQSITIEDQTITVPSLQRVVHIGPENSDDIKIALENVGIDNVRCGVISSSPLGLTFQPLRILITTPNISIPAEFELTCSLVNEDGSISTTVANSATINLVR